MNATLQIDLPEKEIADFCRRWKISELSAFGSVLREDFGPESDIDLLVTFAPETHWTLFDMARMRDELVRLLGREVDLISRRGVETSRNPIRREAILSSAEVIYAA
jgi:predicted nucleotidyltransferase